MVYKLIKMSIISKPILDDNYMNLINSNGFVECPMFSHVQFNMNGDVKINGKVKKYNIKNPKLYYRVKINGKRYSLNRLMAVTFMDINYDDNCIVDHFDHNRHNNDIDNLRISTKSINSSNTKNANLTNPNPQNLINLIRFNKELFYDKSTKQFMLKLYDDLYKIIKIHTKINPKTKTIYKSIQFQQNRKKIYLNYTKVIKYIELQLNKK